MRRKILFLTRWYPNRVDKLDGNFIENHARAVALYCDLAVLHVGADPNMSDRLIDWEVKEEYGFPVVHVWYRNNDVSKKGFGRIVKLFRYLKATRIGWNLIRKKFGTPELSHVHIFTRPAILAFYLRWKYKVPFMITEHSSHFVHDLPVLLPPMKWFAQFTARNAAFITVVSGTLRKAIDDFGFHGKYVIIPNVVFVPKTMAPQNPQEHIRIIAIGGLTDSRKNVAGLIEAFGSIHQQMEKAQLHIIRPVPDAMLQAKAEETGLVDQKIFFHDYLSNDKVYELLIRCSFLVVNSISETFSMSAAEAIACGKPVIVTRCGGPEEFINEERGRLIDINNPAQLKAALLWMYEHYPDFDPETLKAFAYSNFSKEVVGKKILGLYDEVLSTSLKPTINPPPKGE